MDARRLRFRWPLSWDAAPRFLSVLAPGEGRVLLAVLLLCAAGVPLTAADAPLWWFGGALLLAAATLLVRVYGERWAARARDLNAPRTWRGVEVKPLALALDLGCLGLVLLVGTTMFAEVALGDRPVGHEHTVHYARAFALHERLISSGRLLGWSHAWFAGYPASYLDPPGADLWVNAVYALGFGAFGFGTAYALALLLCHLLLGVSVYRFGRLVGGLPCGLIAAVLCLTDLADGRMGGFAHTAESGAWPEALALAFAMMALCSVPAIASERRLAPLGAFGLWMGLAILTHPIQLGVLALLLLATALAAALADGVAAATALFRLALAGGLALLVAAVWLIPFLSSRADAAVAGALWDSTYEQGRGLLALSALPGTLGWVLALGLLGLVVMSRTRRFSLLLTALLALCIPAASSSSFIDEFHLSALAPALLDIEFVRLGAAAKPLWFVLAAYFAVTAVLHLPRLVQGGEDSSVRRPGSHPRAAAFAAVLGLLTLPVLVPAAQAFWTRHVRRSLITASERPLHSERARLEHWLQSELPADGFYRVAVFAPDAELLDLVTLIDRPIYKRGFTPASSFVYQMAEEDPAVLAAVNVRFVISRSHLSSESFTQVAAFGDYRVFSFKRWQPQPFTIVDGGGDVRVERFGAEEIVLRAAKGAHGKLRLNVSYFSRWRAYRDGVRVPMTLTYLREAPLSTGFMTVKLAPGLYRFAFERTLGDRAALPLGLLGVALCALLIAADRRAQRLRRLRAALAAVCDRLDRISQPSWARARARFAFAGFALLLCAGAALASWRPAIPVRELGAVAIDRVRYDFLENLGRASANIEYRQRNQPCLRQGDRLVCRDEAGNLDDGRYVASSPAAIESGVPVRCIRARPEALALLSIRYPDVSRGDAIVGYYGVEHEARVAGQRRPVEFAIMVDGERVHAGQTESDGRMHWFRAVVPRGPGTRATVAFSVRAENAADRDFCFHAQMVRLSPR